jgi:hypothetical protein
MKRIIFTILIVTAQLTMAHETFGDDADSGKVRVVNETGPDNRTELEKEYDRVQQERFQMELNRTQKEIEARAQILADVIATSQKMTISDQRVEVLGYVNGNEETIFESSGGYLVNFKTTSGTICRTEVGSFFSKFIYNDGRIEIKAYTTCSSAAGEIKFVSPMPWTKFQPFKSDYLFTQK